MIRVDKAGGAAVIVDGDAPAVVVQTPARGVQVVRPGPQGPQGEVEFLPALTGEPGSDVVLVDHDPSPHRALIELTVPRGDAGAPGAPIDGILTTKGDLVARDTSTAVRLPVGAPNTVLTADPAAPAGVKWAAPAAAAAGWPQVALWADLPTYTTVPLGTRYHVTSGLGVLYALRGPAGWVVDPASDTGPVAVTVPAATLTQWPGTKVEMRRQGSKVTVRASLGVSTTANAVLAMLTPILATGSGWRFPADWRYTNVPAGQAYGTILLGSFRDTYQIGAYPAANANWTTAGGGSVLISYDLDSLSWPTVAPT